jgi:hypothetical protein
LSLRCEGLSQGCPTSYTPTVDTDCTKVVQPAGVETIIKPESTVLESEYRMSRSAETGFARTRNLYSGQHVIWYAVIVITYAPICRGGYGLNVLYNEKAD